ncbi:MAG: response regulator [Patescibacteria group bacterium]|nr:response regulator [Patescibacteria group bacterium]
MNYDACSSGACATVDPAPKAKVLCVDDDPNVSAAIARSFAHRGLRVLRAFHGMQGLWLAANEKPDAIVLDLGMPNGSGEEVLECLKRNSQTASIPVIVLTGRSDPGLERRVERLGADRFLMKPTSAETLLNEINSLIDGLL